MWIMKVRTSKGEKKKKGERDIHASPGFHSLMHSDNRITFRRGWRKNETRNQFMQQRPEME